LSSPSDQKIARIALIGALVAALGLAGCGRKGGLDPPPAAAVADPAVAAQPGLGPSLDGAPENRAQAPAQGPQRRTPIDFLLN
jgi:predicted small lipoprotein YifL